MSCAKIGIFTKNRTAVNNNVHFQTFSNAPRIPHEPISNPEIVISSPPGTSYSYFFDQKIAQTFKKMQQHAQTVNFCQKSAENATNV